MFKLPCFLFPLFSFFINIASGSNSTSSSTTCRTYNCADGLEIRYPFWLAQGSPPDQHCGYQEFGLICSDDGGYPIFSLPPGLYYHVTNIDYDKRSVHLVDVDTVNHTCPRALHNVPVGNLPLSHSALNLNLSFHYNCSSHPSDASPIRCLTSGANESFVFMMGNETGGFDWSRNCEESVMVTVMKDHITSQGLMNEYARALNEGFVLDWQTATSCDECEASDGFCGYSNSRKELLCFCKDGSVQSNSCSGKSRIPLSKLIIGLIAGGMGALALLICIITFCLRRKSSLIMSAEFWKMKKNDQDIEYFIRNHGPLNIRRYTFSEIKKMTNSFQVKLGEGGYGSVYKGILVNNCPVAVKVLNASKGNGEEFINEVVSVSRTSHVNIVSLLGFCLEGCKRALVFELMPNGSLEKFIHKKDVETNPPLSWEKLHQIAEGIARGLEYLHRGCNTRILHFDIKPNNILLDENFRPKISDFGLAKLCSKTHSIVSMVDARGTVGYIAPEVWNRNFGGVSHKSDVYSYGMMILEMVGGRQKISRELSHLSDLYFPHGAYRQIESNNIEGHDDMTREENEIAKKMIIVGLWCTQTIPSDRPPMNRVIEMLEGSLEQLSIPPKPFLFSPITTRTGEEYCATNALLSFSSDYQRAR